MESASVIPDGYSQVSKFCPKQVNRNNELTNIVGVLPLQPNLKRVVLSNGIIEPLEQVLALFLSDSVDVANMGADREDALPASDRVGADDGVDGLQLTADILGRTTGLLIELEA